MVIECLEKRIVNKDLYRFLIENRFSNLELRLILFWSRHPHAKLSIYTIANAMDTARVNLRDAISSLVTKCVLDGQPNGCGLTTYYLADDQDIRERVNELSQLDWNQLKLLEKQLQEEVVIS